MIIKVNTSQNLRITVEIASSNKNEHESQSSENLRIMVDNISVNVSS